MKKIIPFSPLLVGQNSIWPKEKFDTELWILRNSWATSCLDKYFLISIILGIFSFWLAKYQKSLQNLAAYLLAR
jgi:hypothetical protein